MSKLTSTHARGDGVLLVLSEYERERIEAEIERLAKRAAERAAKRRVRCGAKTRKGHPCRNKSEPGRRRCKFHGGMSTGPKTSGGRERVADAQRKRWADYRRKQGAEMSDKCVLSRSTCARDTGRQPV